MLLEPGLDRICRGDYQARREAPTDEISPIPIASCCLDGSSHEKRNAETNAVFVEKELGFVHNAFSA